jgi:hypothetical protein
MFISDKVNCILTFYEIIQFLYYIIYLYFN